jgi:transcription initiation factor TFIID subunit 2
MPPTASPHPPAGPNDQQLNGAAKAAEKRPKAPKKRKSDEGEGVDRPKKVARVEHGVNGRPRKLVTVPFKAWDKLPSRILDKIRAENAAPAVSSTIVATPALAKRTPLPGYTETPAQVAAAVRPEWPPVADARQSSGLNGNGTPSPLKKRKPLPSSAPHYHPPPAPAATQPPLSSLSANVAEAAAPAAVERPKKLIKLKVKSSSSSQASPPQMSPPR